MKGKRRRAHGVQGGDKNVMLADVLSGKRKGRTSPAQITYSERGNVQGAQFYSVAGKSTSCAGSRAWGRRSPRNGCSRIYATDARRTSGKDAPC